ncbi:DUF2125 domain-containing protein [Paracoccus lichenicola]|nr:DUF2125 domain-containing protein [Paracoccus lichenicola]
MIALALAGLWFAAEPLLVAQARRHVQADGIAPQPGWGRLGLALTGVTLPTQAGRLELPRLDLWVTPLSPTTLRAGLPETAFWDAPAGRRQVGMEDAAAAVTLSPLGSVVRANASFAALALDGAPLSGRGDVTARAVADDRIPGHAFQMRIHLPDLRLPQARSATGGLRLWLDRAPGIGTETPAVLGVMTEGFEIDTGRFTVRLVGQLSKGADGLAQGRVALYGSDAAAMLDRAIEEGLVPPKVRLLARGMLNRVGQMDFAGGGADWPSMPPAAQGQVRIPLEMREGRMFLGTVEIGSAPPWPAF